MTLEMLTRELKFLYGIAEYHKELWTEAVWNNDIEEALRQYDIVKVVRKRLTKLEILVEAIRFALLFEMFPFVYDILNEVKA